MMWSSRISAIFIRPVAAKRPDLWRTFRGWRQGFRGCETRSIITEIEIDGAHRFTAKRVRSEIKIKMNTPVSEDALAEARQKIIDLTRRFGYNDVSIEFRLNVDRNARHLRAVFTINEGEQGHGQSCSI